MAHAFDHIPFEDLAQPFTSLGSGSFGSVFRSTYLGLPVALKQINPSTEYDVHKYFEREWRLMRETRHPNVVLYLGLSRSTDDVVYIISEFVEGGNLRSYIHSKRKPFPWRMRISFATDISRALAYLHARKCIHRDLKPENLLLTSNGRVKITDFGFARIAPRSHEEQKRLTFCGTDSYMSPEILIGESFGLPTDIFSLGVIFCEILSRTLADENHFKRSPPTWEISSTEVRSSATEGCPPGFIELAIDCLKHDPEQRPSMKEILDRLMEIEISLVEKDVDGAAHVGSVKFATGGRRPTMAPRIPSFGMSTIAGNQETRIGTLEIDQMDSDDDSNSSEDELEAALRSLEMKLGAENEETHTYSTAVVRGHSQHQTETAPPNMSSILTIRPTPSLSMDVQTSSSIRVTNGHAQQSSAMSLDVYHTAHSSAMSLAVATIGASEIHSTIRSLPNTMKTSNSLVFHRFTMIKPGSEGSAGTKRNSNANVRNMKPASSGLAWKRSSTGEGFGWSPFDFFLGKGFGGSRTKASGRGSSSHQTKCDLCSKRLGLGFKTVLECDDCGLRAHVKCGEFAPKDCGKRVFPQDSATPNSVESIARSGK